MTKLKAERSSQLEKNNAKPDEKTSAEEKGVEQEETQVDETLVSSRFAEVQDRAVENEITEGAGNNVNDAEYDERSSKRDVDEFAKGVTQNAN